MVVGDVSTGTDVLVIGGGPAGYTAAIRAGQLDLDVALVEKDAYGGTCLNHGCIPSKAMLHATGLVDDVRDAEHMGIHADPAVDAAAMTDWKDEVVEQLTGGVEKLCKANGVDLLPGEATFVDDGTARIAHGGEGQGSETVEFEHAVIATGSRPIELPGFRFEDDPILDSRQALALDSVPESLVIVGAGYVGMELAGVFATLGTDVTVLEALDSALPGWEADLSRPVRKRLEARGVDFHFGLAAEDWGPAGDGTVSVTATPTSDVAADGGERADDARSSSERRSDGGGAAEVEGDGSAAEADDDADAESDAAAAEPETFSGEKVLVAVGREPVTDTLDLEAVGLEPDEDGFLETDERCETAVDGIYAVGDVAGEPMLAHAGAAEGRVAAAAIAGEPAAVDHQAIPAVAFTDPEVATVGMTEDEAAEAGFEPVVGEFPFRASGRALTADESDGFVRVVADEETGFLLGGQVVGPEASELIAEIGLAVEVGARLEDVAGTIHAHPTLAEAVMEACENAEGRAIHTLNR